MIRHFGHAGSGVRITHLADDVASSLALVASAMGTTLVPEPVAQLNWPGVSFAPLVQDEVHVPIQCVYAAARIAPAALALLDLIRAEATG